MTPTPEEIAGVTAVTVSSRAYLFAFIAGLLFSKSWRMAIKYGFAVFFAVTFAGTVAGWLPLWLDDLIFWSGTLMHVAFTLLMASVGYFLRRSITGVYRILLG